MEDKLLDDDDIIDLTDLLEEGEPKKKGKGKESGSKSLTPEPDSFDLGKEISMEYDVSVEEIDHSGESLDIDVSLSSNEQVALTEEKAVAEAPAAPDAADDLTILESADQVMQAEQKEAPVQEEPVITAPVVDEPVTEVEIPADIPAEEPVFELKEETAGSPSLDASPEEIDMPIIPEKKPIQVVVAKNATVEMDNTFEKEPEEAPAVRTQVSSDVLGEMKQEVPAIIEGIVRPLVSELIREITLATREQLPGIVEKVIREEIEKLKKLDS